MLKGKHFCSRSLCTLHQPWSSVLSSRSRQSQLSLPGWSLKQSSPPQSSQSWFFQKLDQPRFGYAQVHRSGRRTVTDDMNLQLKRNPDQSRLASQPSGLWRTLLVTPRAVSKIHRDLWQNVMRGHLRIRLARVRRCGCISRQVAVPRVACSRFHFLIPLSPSHRFSPSASAAALVAARHILRRPFVV